MRICVYFLSLAVFILPQAGRADPAFDFHYGPCVFASPASGSIGPVTCRSLVSADIPASSIPNSSLVNSSLTIGSTSISLGATASSISGLTLSSPIISGGTIDGATIGGSIPSAISATTISSSSVISGGGAFSTLSASGSFAGAPSVAVMAFLGGTAYFLSYGADTASYHSLSIGQPHSDGSNYKAAFYVDTSQNITLGQSYALLNSSGVLSVSSGLANSVGFTGSSTNPTISTSGGDLNLFPSSGFVRITGGGGGGGTGTQANIILDPKTGTANSNLFDISNQGSSGVVFRLLNDAYSSATVAYIIGRGTTFNVSLHNWYTSTVAGTAVLGMQLTPTVWSLASSITAQFGTLTASTCTNSGYISINDSGGTPRKLMVCT